MGTSLYVGETLACAKYKAEILYNECTVLPVMDCQAASWFFTNTQTIWSKNHFAIEHINSEERREIGQELYKLMQSFWAIM
jgi:hypothetical protein